MSSISASSSRPTSAMRIPGFTPSLSTRDGGLVMRFAHFSAIPAPISSAAERPPNTITRRPASARASSMPLRGITRRRSPRNRSSFCSSTGGAAKRAAVDRQGAGGVVAHTSVPVPVASSSRFIVAFTGVWNLETVNHWKAQFVLNRTALFSVQWSVIVADSDIEGAPRCPFPGRHGSAIGQTDPGQGSSNRL